MKKANRGRLFLVCVLVLGAVFMWSTAWADFYVIAAGKRAKRTVLVSPQSTAVASGTALLNAQNGINDASATNPYLIIIEPGVYDIGSSSLQMKSYVDIQGSGENVTKITGNIDSISSGVLKGADDAELRFLTVENTSGGGACYAHAIYNSSCSPKMTHVTATAAGGTWSYGVYNNNSSPTMTNVTVATSGETHNYGVLNNSSSSPTMTNVTVTVTASGEEARNYGVLNNSSSPTMTSVTVVASGGTSNYGVQNNNSSSTMTSVTVVASGGTSYNYGVNNMSSSTTKIDHSVISGTTTINTDESSYTYIGNTRLKGGAVNGYHNTCAGVYDENFVFYPNTCP